MIQSVPEGALAGPMLSMAEGVECQRHRKSSTLRSPIAFKDQGVSALVLGTALPISLGANIGVGDQQTRCVPGV